MAVATINTADSTPWVFIRLKAELSGGSKDRGKRRAGVSAETGGEEEKTEDDEDGEGEDAAGAGVDGGGRTRRRRPGSVEERERVEKALAGNILFADLPKETVAGVVQGLGIRDNASRQHPLTGVPLLHYGPCTDVLDCMFEMEFETATDIIVQGKHHRRAKPT